MSNAPEDAHRLIQDTIAELGWSADISVLVDRVRRLNVGLPCEDEFSVICSWLGKCDLLHKLDQQQVPAASRSKYQVPDLLAVFNTETGPCPVLIEIKAKNENKLSLTPEYLEKLNQYAGLFKLPLLFAWKYERVWALFEARHLKKAKKNFNITFSDAMHENLLGVLAGDVAYSIGEGAGLHLRFRKDKLVSQQDEPGARTEEWVATIDDVAITDRTGAKRDDIDPEVKALFSTWDLDEKEDHNETHIQLSFVARGGSIEFAHTALVHLLRGELDDKSEVHWRTLLRKEQVTATIKNFSAALYRAYEQKVVSLILHQVPQTWPGFMAPRKNAIPDASDAS